MTTRTPRLDHPDGELRWVGDPRWSSVTTPTTRAVIGDHHHLLVVAAHPDDECLGAGAFIADAAALGVDVTLLILTSGEASHPRSSTVSREDLGARRRAEGERAAAELAPAAHVVHVGLPDGGLAERQEEISAAVASFCSAGTLVLAPWTSDGHPDHDAAGRATRTAVLSRTSAGEAGVSLAHYLVWFWHWGAPEELRARRYRRLDLAPGDAEARRAALDAHASQVRPLSAAPGDEAILGPAVLAHHERPFEAHRVSGPDDADAHRAAAVFDRLYRAQEDPWRYLSSSYEARKRALTLAALPRPRYGTVVEAGASIGVLTADVAARADRVVGLEASSTAVERAAARLAGAPHAEVRRAVLPADWPADVAGADLVIASEIGYFLQPEELDALIDDADAALAPGGELLLCHWRHPIEGWPLDGDAVHARVAADPRWRLRTELVEDDFRLSLHVRAAAATHAVVVVPAKDEQERLPAALAALTAALDRWEEHHAQGTAAVVVAADRCDDATVAAALEARAADPRIHVLELGEPTAGQAGVGRARVEGARRARALFPDVPAERLWLASTDADSRVPADWLLAQTVAAGRDEALVLGTVDVRQGPLRQAWLRGYRHEEGHPHVHGANLGLPWSLYEAVGGFPPVAEHEDVGLAEAVRALAGERDGGDGRRVRVIATDTTRVLTSSRLEGRTPGGFSGYLKAVGRPG